MHISGGESASIAKRSPSRFPGNVRSVTRARISQVSCIKTHMHQHLRVLLAGTSADELAEQLFNVPQAPLPFLYASHGRSLLQARFCSLVIVRGCQHAQLS
jgi:hypothetical protein